MYVYLEIVQVDALLSVSHPEEREHEQHGEDGPDEVPDRDYAGVPAKPSTQPPDMSHAKNLLSDYLLMKAKFTTLSTVWALV